jgi:TolA-binding protein
MRKLMMAVGAVAGLSLMAGCQDNKDKVAQEQRDVAEAQAKASEKVADARKEASEEKTEAQQDANKELANANQDATEAQRNAQQEMANADKEAQEKTAGAQQDIDEERKDVAEARQEQAQDARENAEGSATGGSGAAAAMTLTGTLKDTTMAGNLEVVDANGKEMKLKTDDQTKVMYNNKAAKMDSFDEGTQVRASYVKDGDDMLAREVTVLKPVMKK